MLLICHPYIHFSHMTLLVYLFIYICLVTPQNPGVPLTIVNLRKPVYLISWDPYMRKNGHVEPIHHTHQNITHYITLVSRVNYTLIQHVSIIMFHTCFTQIYKQSHISTLFSKPASSERRLPEYSLYLKVESHDEVSNAQ